MSITFSCVFCGQKLDTEDAYQGQQFECPVCGQSITVPSAYGNGKGVSKENNSCNNGYPNKKLAISKIKHGQFEEAFKFAHNSACTEEDILTFLLKISFRDHDFMNTLTYAERLIELHSQSSIGYRWKAENLDDGYDKTKESIRFSTKAIELDPNDAYAYVIRGNTKRWMEPADFEGATKDYNAAINIDEN